MHRTRLVVYLCVIAPIAVFSACQKAQAPAPALPAPPTAQTVPGPVPGEWERLTSLAKKEGSLVIVGTSLGATKQVMSQAFRSKYGVNIEYIDGRGAEVVAKVLAERTAGLYTVDVGHTGDSTFFDVNKSKKVTVPLRPFLLLPEVTDGARWRGGKLPFMDTEGHAMAFAAMSIPLMIVNTGLVKEDEIKKSADLLSPRWKGKVVLGDPTTSGAGSNWFTHVVTQLYRREEGLQFMREFARQEPVITRDNRLLVEWVARGKYPIGIGNSMAVTAEFKGAGAPIAYAGLGDRSMLSSGSGNVYVFDNAPHPDAAKLYVNWLLSKEGSELWAPAHGYPSLRTDVANDSFEPALIPPKDAILKTQEYIAIQAELREVAKEIFRDLLK